MHGDPFRKVLPGQKLAIPAEAFNGFVDTANFVRSRRHDTDADVTDEVRQTSIVRVRNNSGFAIPRFGVLALTEPIVAPSDNLEEFKNRLSFEGRTPIEPVASGRFAVLLEPLDVNAIGRGVVAGVTPVRLTVEPDHLYEFAEMEPGTTQSLQNVPAGSTRVLWMEEGEALERWALVRLGDGEAFLRFRLTESLDRCGSASAKRVVFRDGKWCPTEVEVTVHDSMGVVCPDLCVGDDPPGEGCECSPATSVPAGTFGLAKWFDDSRKWEVVTLGEGCCQSSSSSGSTASGSSWLGSSSGGSASSFWGSSGSSIRSSSSWNSSGFSGSSSSAWSSSHSSGSGSSTWSSSGESSSGTSSSGTSSSGTSSSGWSSSGSSGQSSGSFSGSGPSGSSSTSGSSGTLSGSSSGFSGSSMFSSSGVPSSSGSTTSGSSGVDRSSSSDSSGMSFASGSSGDSGSGSSAGDGSSGDWRSSSWFSSYSLWSSYWPSSGTWPSSSQWLSSGVSPSGSGSDDGVGSGSSGGGGIDITETDIRCENGKLMVYRRVVTLQLAPIALPQAALAQTGVAQAALARTVGGWQVSHQAGCCRCGNGGGGSSGVPTSGPGPHSSLVVIHHSSGTLPPASSAVVLHPQSSAVEWPDDSP